MTYQRDDTESGMDGFDRLVCVTLEDLDQEMAYLHSYYNGQLFDIGDFMLQGEPVYIITKPEMLS